MLRGRVVLVKPIRMHLKCPACGCPHVDRLEADGVDWSQRPHRTHLCKPEDGGCGGTFRVAMVCTVGVPHGEPLFKPLSRFALDDLQSCEADLHDDERLEVELRFNGGRGGVSLRFGDRDWFVEPGSADARKILRGLA